MTFINLRHLTKKDREQVTFPQKSETEATQQRLGAYSHEEMKVYEYFMCTEWKCK
jgi:hypothetical protein